MQVAVTGIGLICALGTNLNLSWQHLLAGESGIKLAQPFPELTPKPLALIKNSPSDINLLIDIATHDALQDAGLTVPLPDCAVIVGSSRSYQGQWERFLALESSSNQLSHWLESLPQAIALSIARQIHATGLVYSPMAACATGSWAIAQAALAIDTGATQQAIAGAVETPITPLTLAGFQQMGALAQTGCYPFDKQREGLVLGEACTLLVLESLQSAHSRNASIYGYITGFGLTADGYHLSAPDPSSIGAKLAIQHSLDRANLTSPDIGYIHAHGTSTPLNDRNEANLIQQLFPAGVPVSSSKGATGHPLGASGALGVAFTLMALKHQVLPPCTGLNNPEFELDFVKTARYTAVNNALCLSFGFGGQNSAIALSKADQTLDNLDSFSR